MDQILRHWDFGLEDYWEGYKNFCYAYYSHNAPHVQQCDNLPMQGPKNRKKKTEIRVPREFTSESPNLVGAVRSRQRNAAPTALALKSSSFFFLPRSTCTPSVHLLQRGWTSKQRRFASPCRRSSRPKRSTPSLKEVGRRGWTSTSQHGQENEVCRPSRILIRLTAGSPLTDLPHSVPTSRRWTAFPLQLHQEQPVSGLAAFGTGRHLRPPSGHI